MNIKSFIGRTIDKIRRPGIVSYAQEGEDLILRRYFETQKKGFYVDVGAYHPIQVSNTHYFYRKGWSGINIDANPDAIRVFQRTRRRDVNLHSAVGKDGEEILFYRFQNNVAAINTCDKNLAEQWQRAGYSQKDVLPVTTRSLYAIFSKHISPHQDIDFMSIDVEGYELSVLTSNDWNMFRPKVLLVEILENGGRGILDIPRMMQNPVYKFLNSINYSYFAKTYNTAFFLDNSLTK